MLTLSGVDKRFGALSALSGIDLEIDAGEIFGIIGPNGSGKTTLLNTVTGVHKPEAGRITYKNTDITGWSSHRIAGLGIARTFQNVRLFPTMTVFQNLWAAQHRKVSGGLLGLLRSRPASGSDSVREIERVLESVGLLQMRDVLVKNLPLPSRRRLEIGRLLTSNAQLVLLDEPAGGMTQIETAEMTQLIQAVVAPGRTCVVIEHKMALISSVCTRLCVLDFGRKIAEGPPGSVLANEKVREAYLGETDQVDA